MLHMIEIRKKNFLAESKPNIAPTRNRKIDDDQNKTKRHTKISNIAVRYKIKSGFEDVSLVFLCNSKQKCQKKNRNVRFFF